MTIGFVKFTSVKKEKGLDCDWSILSLNEVELDVEVGSSCAERINIQ